MYRGLLLLAALAALFSGGQAGVTPAATPHCMVVDKATPKYKVNDLKGLKLTACADKAASECTECYSDVTHADTKDIKYFANCGAKPASTTGYTCKTTTKCEAATDKTCYPTLKKLLEENPSTALKTQHCKHAELKSDTADMSKLKDPKDAVICKASDKCATGVGYDSTGALKIGYVGCRKECDKKVEGKKAKGSSGTDATCIDCDSDCAPASTTAAPSKSTPAGTKKVDTPGGKSAATTSSDSTSIHLGNPFRASIAAVIAIGWFHAINYYM